MMAGNFGISGYLVLVVYMVAAVALGLSFARKQDTLASYFLAERAAPWWAVGISVLACDMSAISYMGSPSYTYYNDLRLPMGIVLLPVVAVVVAFLFIPFLARLQVYTIYEYLEHRFSLSSRLFASLLFSMQRATHIAIAIYAVSLALQQIIGWPIWACASLIGGITTLYTVFGGMKGCAVDGRDAVLCVDRRYRRDVGGRAVEFSRRRFTDLAGCCGRRTHQAICVQQ